MDNFTQNDIELMMKGIGQNAQTAAKQLARASSKAKETALHIAAEEIWSRRDELIVENAKDMDFGREKNLSQAMMDRLLLTEERIKAMCDGMRQVAEMADPVGQVMEAWSMPSGLDIERVRTPIGVIGVIFESRPNVTADAAALCIKSGNAAILRGGSESLYSATLIRECIADGLKQAGLDENSVQIVPTRDRRAVQELLTMVEYVDVIVPRGGKGLVGLVQSEARVPVFAHLEGIVHLYIDKDADPKKAEAVVLNAKTRRTGICGALECLVVDSAYREKHGDHIIHALMNAGVEVRADEAHQSIKGVIAAQEDDWGREYLDMIIAVREVQGIDEAIDYISNHHSQHTDGIVTENPAKAEQFFNALDSAILMWNASTQFADGGEFGMGAEIGIATGKLHARGPVGATQLTSFKYRVKGDGALRP